MSGLKKIMLLILCLVLAVCFWIPTEGEAYVQTAVTAQPSQTVIIDAGHGGFDGGASAADGTEEKNINLSIALKLKKLLTLGGFEVIMTRETDEGTEADPSDTISNRKVSDMRRRLEIINENPDAIFVSIHLNKFTTSSVSGAQVFYSPNNESSLLLAESLQKSVVSRLQPENERVVKKSDNSIYLLKNSQIPSVIVECGFLSNAAELALLKDEQYQSKMAFSIYCGVLEYFK